MTIDPRISVILSITLAVMAFIAGAGATLTTLFGAHDTAIILALVTLLLGIGNAVNAVLGAIPSAPGAHNQFWLGPKDVPPATPPVNKP